jgi:hypothetical protein
LSLIAPPVYMDMYLTALRQISILCMRNVFCKRAALYQARIADVCVKCSQQLPSGSCNFGIVILVNKRITVTRWLKEVVQWPVQIDTLFLDNHVVDQRYGLLHLHIAVSIVRGAALRANCLLPLVDWLMTIFMSHAHKMSVHVNCLYFSRQESVLLNATSFSCHSSLKVK